MRRENGKRKGYKSKDETRRGRIKEKNRLKRDLYVWGKGGEMNRDKAERNEKGKEARWKMNRRERGRKSVDEGATLATLLQQQI